MNTAKIQEIIEELVVLEKARKRDAVFPTCDDIEE